MLTTEMLTILRISQGKQDTGVITCQIILINCGKEIEY